jgi:hypothetical protein
MARPSKTPASRVRDVGDAGRALAAALDRAEAAVRTHGYDHAETRSAWETVENIGATIHRQSRILAGKSRGG